LDRKRGPLPCSSHSPDSSPLDFFFWEVVKDILCHEKVQNMYVLLDRIVRAAVCVTNKMLSITWRETEYHLDVCCATNGAHIETY